MKLRPAKQNGALCPVLLRELSRTFDLSTFVETGTYFGETAARAAELFDEVHSIELSEKLYRQTQARFADVDHVALHHGDSSTVLAELLPSLRGPSLLWLDAHYSEGDTAKGRGNTPILDELRLIADHMQDDHVVLIDDLRLFDSTSMQRDGASSLQGYPLLHELMEACMEIGPGYRFAVYGDVGIAYPSGRIEMSPVVKACTLSRLFDEKQSAVLEDAVFNAEEIISTASGEERETLLGLPNEMLSSEAWNVGGHYRLWRGLAVAGSGTLSDAEADFARAVDLGCDHWRIRWYLAQAQEAAGRVHAAVACLTRVVEEAADFAAARTRLTTLTSAHSGDGSGHSSDCATALPSIAQYRHASVLDRYEAKSSDDLGRLQTLGLWAPGQPLRLHLGCGETFLDGYINIDYPTTHHNVMSVEADYYADITRLNFPEGSVDEVRLHHVFEHFSRVEALAQLIRWHSWLKIGGQIHLETPDLVGCARVLTSDAPWRHKMAAVRHLSGDQAAEWAYHLDHWFPERFKHTLSTLGFGTIDVSSDAWAHPPHLVNATVRAAKCADLSESDLLKSADELLWESTVADAERPTFTVWQRQLRDHLDAGRLPHVGIATTERSPSVETANPSDTMNLDLSTLTDALPELNAAATDLPLDEIHNFNQRERDRWVAAMASSIPAGSRVLDVGAGTCPYRHLFAHCDYRTHDFKKYAGEKLGGTSEYGEIDYVSDIVDIPVPDASFDVLLCTEVIEHVPEPIRALEEMARIVKPGGRLLITAPLGSGLHQLPYHFHGGYTPYWYEHFAAQFGLEIRKITPNGGFFRLLAQECNRFAWTYRQNAHLQGANRSEIFNFFSDVLPRYLFGLEERHFMDQFTVGYHVEMAKPVHKPTECRDHESALLGAVWASDAAVDATTNATGLEAVPLDHSGPVAGPQSPTTFDLGESNHTAAPDDDITIEEMRDSLLDALSRGGQATDNLTLLAQAALEVGDLDTARRCLESTLIIDDTHVGARSMLRQISAESDV